MNPAANGTASVSIGSAFTIIVNAWLVRLGYHALSPDESAAYIAVLTAAISYYLHLRTSNANFRLIFRRRQPQPSAA